MSPKSKDDSRLPFILIAASFVIYLLWQFVIQPIILWVQGNWVTSIIILATIIILAILAVILYFKYRSPVSSVEQKTKDNSVVYNIASSPMSLEQFQHYIMNLHWREFELYINDLFGKLNFQVTATQSTRDGGIDVKASRTDELGIKHDYIIQCKHYENSPIGRPVLQQLWGNMTDSTPHRMGIIVCTSRLTKDAKEFAETHNIPDWDIDYLYKRYLEDMK